MAFSESEFLFRGSIGSVHHVHSEIVPAGLIPVWEILMDYPKISLLDPVQLTSRQHDLSYCAIMTEFGQTVLIPLTVHSTNNTVDQICFTNRETPAYDPHI